MKLHSVAVRASQPVPERGRDYLERGQEFQETESAELPLNGVAAPQREEDRRLELREAALRGTPREKAKFLEEDVFIPTADFVYVTDTISSLIKHAKMSRSAGGMRVRGPGGAGKDAIIRYVTKQRPGFLEGPRRTNPIVTVKFGGYLAPIDILGSMHAQLGSAYKKYQGIEDLQKLLLEVLAECQTEAVIFNEAQHMLPTTRKARSELRLAGKAGDWLKGFIDMLPIPVFLFGVPGWDAIFDQDRQLGTRIPNHHDLKVPDEATFLGILQALDEAIPMPEPAGLATPALAGPILEITEANWRLLITFLSTALVSASQAGAKRIQRQDMSYSFALTFGADRNPFGHPRAL